MISSLRKGRANNFQGMLIVKDDRTDYDPPTLLLRWVEQNGASVAFFATGEARNSFLNMETMCIYQGEIRGTCVQNVNKSSRFGVTSNVEVNLKHLTNFTLSQHAWPLQHAYDFQDWEALNQKEDGVLIDFIGRAVGPPEEVPNPTLRKATLTLINGNLEQRVTLLGQHVCTRIRTDDIVAFRGLLLKVYREVRSLQTLILTAVEVNPTVRNGIPTIEDQDMDEPLRKAMKITLAEGLSVQQALAITASMALNSTHTERNFTFVGKFKILTETFFTDNAPFIDKGDTVEMLWKTIVSDATGEMPVTVWNNGCYVVFDTVAKSMQELWAAGEEDATKRTSLLANWNERLQFRYRCVCTAKLWKGRCDVNVNEVEMEG